MNQETNDKKQKIFKTIVDDIEYILIDKRSYIRCHRMLQDVNDQLNDLRELLGKYIIKNCNECNFKS